MYERIWCQEQVEDMRSKNGGIILCGMNLSIVVDDISTKGIVIDQNSLTPQELSIYMRRTSGFYLIRTEHV